MAHAARPSIPVFRPLLPTADEILPYLREIDATRWYSNFGPLVMRFEQRLARHFGIDADELITSANATLALAQTLRALAPAGAGVCVMPSWTFSATPSAAVWAGLEPYFVDVDPHSWAISPDHVRQVMKTRQVGAVIVVAPFGAPLDLSVWDAFTHETGVPVIVDAASGFDSYATIAARLSTTPIVISLQATKVFGIGEGAIVLAHDRKLRIAIREYGNFGFSGTRESVVPGLNAKMTEYAAAVGLATLEIWPERRRQWAELTRRFQDGVRRIQGLTTNPGLGEGWVSSYGIVQFADAGLARAAEASLTAAGVETRRWWGKGCHLQAAFSGYGREDMDHTTRIGDQSLGLPFWLGLSDADLQAGFDALTSMAPV